MPSFINAPGAPDPESTKDAAKDKVKDKPAQPEKGKTKS